MLGILDITLTEYYQETKAAVVTKGIDIIDLKLGQHTVLSVLPPVYGYVLTKGIRGDYDSARGKFTVLEKSYVIDSEPNVIGNNIKLVVPVVYTGEDFVKEVG